LPQKDRLVYRIGHGRLVDVRGRLVECLDEGHAGWDFAVVGADHQPGARSVLTQHAFELQVGYDVGFLAEAEFLVDPVERALHPRRDDDRIGLEFEDFILHLEPDASGLHSAQHRAHPRHRRQLRHRFGFL